MALRPFYPFLNHRQAWFLECYRWRLAAVDLLNRWICFIGIIFPEALMLSSAFDDENRDTLSIKKDVLRELIFFFFFSC